MAPCSRPKFGHPWGYPPKIGEDLSEIGRTAVQNFTPIGKAPAEKSVAVPKKSEKQ